MTSHLKCPENLKLHLLLYFGKMSLFIIESENLEIILMRFQGHFLLRALFSVKDTILMDTDIYFLRNKSLSTYLTYLIHRSSYNGCTNLLYIGLHPNPDA